MKKTICKNIYLFFSLIFILQHVMAIAQEKYDLRYQDYPGVTQLNEPPEEYGPEITFLSEIPKIDGLLDDNLQTLPVREFNFVMQDRTDEKLPIGKASYRMAYGTGFLYVYIEADGDKLNFRDRAFQNGDGFFMLLAVPKSDNARTDEYYILACAAVNNERMEWTRRIFWSYNIDTIFMRTKPETTLEFQVADGKISFELYLPWDSVYPYHPWISKSIGFNLCFVKAAGEKARNRYIVFPDAYIAWENKKQAYYHLKFEKPEFESVQQTYLILKKNHIQQGDPITLKAVTLSSEASEEQISLDLKTQKMKNTIEHTWPYGCKAGVNTKEHTIDSRELAAGNYQIEWTSSMNDSKGQIELTVLPDFDGEAYKERLESVHSKITEGSFSTLLFEVEEVEQDLKDLEPYETSSSLPVRISHLQKYLSDAEKGEDFYADRTGFFRRAFRSELDNTLQPYSVRIPKDFDPAKKYPLLVFLHGSASDEWDMYGFQFLIPPDFIAIGPNARGPSHNYVRDNAQEDIAEAIDSVIANYPIDTEKIILSGFSMGGYGVYRTFYETPEKFKALIVLSGTPNLWKPEHPDFLEDEYLQTLKNIPIFIYHGKKDLNIPYQKTENLVEKMKELGISVEFHAEKDKGHEIPGKTIVAAIQEWIREVISK